MGGKKEAAKAPAKKIMSLKPAKPKAKPPASAPAPEDDDPMPLIREEEEPTKEEEPPKVKYVNMQWESRVNIRSLQAACCVLHVIETRALCSLLPLERKH